MITKFFREEVNLREYLTKDNLRFETIFGNLNAFGLLNFNLESFVKDRFTKYFEQCYPQTPENENAK